jgi:hypothetical protein
MVAWLCFYTQVPDTQQHSSGNYIHLCTYKNYSSVYFSVKFKMIMFITGEGYTWYYYESLYLTIEGTNCQAHIIEDKFIMGFQNMINQYST